MLCYLQIYFTLKIVQQITTHFSDISSWIVNKYVSKINNNNNNIILLII